MKQLKAKIASNEKLSGDFYRMRLASNYLAKRSLPGQFVEIRCAGGVDPLLRRPLGVHRTWPGGIEVLYEIVGKGTALLSEKRSGEELDLIGPLGNGFDLGLASDINILVAGGIGVAPLPALAEKIVYSARLPDGATSVGQVKRIADRKRKKMHVFIGAKTKTHILCEKEFKGLGCTVMCATEDGSKGRKGLATDLLKDLLKTYDIRTTNDERRTTIYACGPTGMLKAVSKIALEHGMACQVSLEERMACGVGVCLGCPVKVKSGGYKMVCKDGPVFNAEEIAW